MRQNLDRTMCNEQRFNASSLIPADKPMGGKAVSHAVNQILKRNKSRSPRPIERSKFGGSELKLERQQTPELSDHSGNDSFKEPPSGLPAMSAIKEVQHNADYQNSFLRLTLGQRAILRKASAGSDAEKRMGPQGPRDVLNPDKDKPSETVWPKSPPIIKGKLKPPQNAWLVRQQ